MNAPDELAGNFVEALREAMFRGDMPLAQLLISEFETLLRQRQGMNKYSVYAKLRDEVLGGFGLPERAEYEAFLLEAGAL
jgi:hypothetical protein